MQVFTNLGAFSIVQAQPPDSREVAVYHWRSPDGVDLEPLQPLTTLAWDIHPASAAGGESYIVAESID